MGGCPPSEKALQTVLEDEYYSDSGRDVSEPCICRIEYAHTLH